MRALCWPCRTAWEIDLIVHLDHLDLDWCAKLTYCNKTDRLLRLSFHAAELSRYYCCRYDSNCISFPLLFHLDCGWWKGAAIKCHRCWEDTRSTAAPADVRQRCSCDTRIYSAIGNAIGWATAAAAVTIPATATIAAATTVTAAAAATAATVAAAATAAATNVASSKISWQRKWWQCHRK